MKKLFFFALAAALGSTPLTAQGQEPGIRTEHGFRFVNHVNRPGPKAQQGSSVMLHVHTYIGDSLMASTRQYFGGPRELTLPKKENLPTRVPPVFDALLLMSEGDSATISEPIDSFLAKFIPEALKDEKEIRYQIVLTKLFSPEEVRQKLEMEEKTRQKELANAEAVQKRAEPVGKEVAATTEKYRSGQLRDKLSVTASGLKVLVVEKGAGAPLKKGEPIRTHYYGVLTDGTMFDNSFERGEALPFNVGTKMMIPGYDEGAMLLNHGGKAYLFIPSELGYGPQAQGNKIPANSELIFYIEVL